MIRTVPAAQPATTSSPVPASAPALPPVHDQPDKALPAVDELVRSANRAFQSELPDWIQHTITDLHERQFARLSADDLPQLLSALEDRDLEIETQALLVKTIANIIERDPRGLDFLRTLGNDPQSPNKREVNLVLSAVNVERMSTEQRQAFAALGRALVSGPPENQDVPLDAETLAALKPAAGHLPSSLESVEARKYRIGVERAEQPMTAPELQSLLREICLAAKSKEPDRYLEVVYGTLRGKVGKKEFSEFIEAHDREIRGTDGAVDSQKVLNAFGRTYPHLYGDALYDLAQSLGVERVTQARESVGLLIVARGLQRSGTSVTDFVHDRGFSPAQKTAVIRTFTANLKASKNGDVTALANDVTLLLQTLGDDPESLPLKSALMSLAGELCGRRPGSTGEARAQAELMGVLLRTIEGELHSGELPRVVAAARLVDRISNDPAKLRLIGLNGEAEPRRLLGSMLLESLGTGSDRRIDEVLVHTFAELFRQNESAEKDFQSAATEEISTASEQKDHAWALANLQRVAIDPGQRSLARCQAVSELYILDDEAGLRAVAERVKDTPFAVEYVGEILATGEQFGRRERFGKCYRKMEPALSMLENDPKVAEEFRGSNVLTFSRPVAAARFLWAINNTPEKWETALKQFDNTRISSTESLESEFAIVRSLSRLDASALNPAQSKALILLSGRVMHDGLSDEPVLDWEQTMVAAEAVVKLAESDLKGNRDSMLMDRLEQAKELCSRAGDSTEEKEAAAQLRSRIAAIQGK